MNDGRKSIKESNDIYSKPREKMLSMGQSALSDSELIALIIGVGSKELSAIELGQVIIKKLGGIKKLARTSIDELTKIKGVGLAKACQILAVIELSKRIKNSMLLDEIRLDNPKKIFEYMYDELKNMEQEAFIVLALNTKLKLIKKIIVSIGTVNSTPVHPRDVFREVIRYNASSIILIHNHPSGDTNPSDDDVNLTRRLIKSGEVLGISVSDHIIIGDNYYSFAENNLM